MQLAEPSTHAQLTKWDSLGTLTKPMGGGSAQSTAASPYALNQKCYQLASKVARFLESDENKLL